MNPSLSFYRSDTIKSYRLVMPRQTAWEVMSKLGQFSLIHVVNNKNPVLLKPFAHQVKRCEESLMKVSHLQTALAENNINQEKIGFSDIEYKGLFNQYAKQEKRGLHSASLIENVQKEIDESWEQFKSMKKHVEQLSGRSDLYRENLAVIRAGQKNFKRIFLNSGDLEDEFDQNKQNSQMVHFKCGVIREDEKAKFEKLVFRITRGNSIVTFDHFQSIFTDVTDVERRKTVFFVLFPAFQKAYFEKKLNKLVETYCETKYDIPKHLSQFDQKINEFQKKYEESEVVHSLTQEKMHDFLRHLSTESQQSPFTKLQYLKFYLIKQREIYSQLNQMDIYRNFIIGNIFVRNDDVQNLHGVLSSIEKQIRLPAGQIVLSKTGKYPTNFVTNDYTGSAQEIVETYGVARYKEANPAFFTTITFPFLFGVMFGDIAHGFLLFFFGLYLIFTHSQKSVLRIVMPHRYLIALMGFFATYCGFIYNEFLSISLNLFSSCYQVKENVIPGESFQRISEQCIYPFGLDPVWYVSENSLNFVNSLKMKLAVIIGVTHMTLGIFVKATNVVHFRKRMDFIFEFIPQLLFMVLFFGYMDFLIIFKWCKNWGFANPSAPSIITTMINMPLKLGKTDHCCGGEPMWGEYGNTSQDTIQLIFLVICVLCIPLMLLPKPIYQICIKKSHDDENVKAQKLQNVVSRVDPHPQKVSESKIQRYIGSYKSIPLKHKDSFDSKFDMEQFYEQLVYEFDHEKGKENVNKQIEDYQEVEEHHDASEIFVHQMIETIEFVLGCISNTASYLRLWALSLAHSQLAEVFLNKSVESGLIKGFWGIPMMILFFPIFAGTTFGVLLCMDVMQCFLHTLRLHWVEFQNKFYKADGFAFKAFSFQGQMENASRRS